MKYELAKQLKDLDFSQEGDGGWYCMKCKHKISTKEEILHEECIVDGGYQILSIPSLRQMFKEVERDERGFNVLYSISKKHYIVRAMKNFKEIEIVEPDIEPALAKLIIELGRA